MADEQWEIPPAWERLDLSRPRGVVMVIGGSDTGKSVFVRYLADRLRETGVPPAILDGDPGQSRLGPPATLSLALPGGNGSKTGRQSRKRHWFVGAVSPTGHMLEVATGAFRLARAARRSGVRVILHDTSGLIDPERGGHALKRAKIDLLDPGVVIALSRERELEKLLIPLRRSRRARVIDLPVSPGVRPRDRSARKGYRTRRFADYFSDAGSLSIQWLRYAVIPEPYFPQNGLVGLIDAEGFCRGVGIVTEVVPPERRILIKTPIRSLRDIDMLAVGDLRVDPETFEDQPIRRR